MTLFHGCRFLLYIKIWIGLWCIDVYHQFGGHSYVCRIVVAKFWHMFNFTNWLPSSKFGFTWPIGCQAFYATIWVLSTNLFFSFGNSVLRVHILFDYFHFCFQSYGILSNENIVCHKRVACLLKFALTDFH